MNRRQRGPGHHRPGGSAPPRGVVAVWAAGCAAGLALLVGLARPAEVPAPVWAPALQLVSELPGLLPPGARDAAVVRMHGSELRGQWTLAAVLSWRSADGRLRLAAVTLPGGAAVPLSAPGGQLAPALPVPGLAAALRLLLGQLPVPALAPAVPLALVDESGRLLTACAGAPAAARCLRWAGGPVTGYPVRLAVAQAGGPLAVTVAGPPRGGP